MLSQADMMTIESISPSSSVGVDVYANDTFILTSNNNAMICIHASKKKKVHKKQNRQHFSASECNPFQAQTQTRWRSERVNE